MTGGSVAPPPAHPLGSSNDQRPGGWRRRVHTLVALGIVAVTAGAVAVTGRLGDSGRPAAARSVATELPATSATSVTSVTSALNATDIAFIELMIPMNERARPLLDALTNDADATLSDVATTLATAYPPEVTALRAALAAGGVAFQGLHADMDMPGYVTQAQVAAATSGSRADREAAAREALCQHLAQSLLVARSELTAGSDAATVAVAEGMVSTRGPHLTALACGSPATP